MIIMERILFFFFISVVASCTPKADSIVYKSIQAHGFDIFSNKDTIQYSKTIQVYDSLGRILKILEQEHIYRPSPLYYQISYRDSTGISTMVQDEKGFYQLKNGKALTDSISVRSTQKSIESALFVFWQPRKLDDPNAQFLYLGVDTLLSGQVAHLIEVRYSDDASEDEWIFFFDTSSYLNLGYQVRHNTKLSLILNEAFYKKEGYPILVHKRSSYLILDNTTRLQADYVYRLKID